MGERPTHRQQMVVDRGRMAMLPTGGASDVRCEWARGKWVAMSWREDRAKNESE